MSYQVVILVGGLGTRLRGVVNEVPKPMAQIGNKPFLEYLVLLLRENGFKKFLFLTGYKSGKIIRKLRLDELPQFWNIIKGNMSIVGPRPEMLEFHNMMSNQIPFYNYRLKLNPGITGWAQIHYKHTSTLEDYIKKTEYDLYYIKNRNIFLDIKIMLKTVETMLGMRGTR